MEIRFINNNQDAIVKQGRAVHLLVQGAHIVIQKLRNYWAKVLCGHTPNGAWVRIVLGTLSFGEKLLMGAREILRALIPNEMGFKFKTVRFDFEFVWR